MIFDHLIGNELRSQVLLSLLPGCLSKDVTGTPRNLRSPLFGCLCLHRVSVLRRDRLTSSYLLRNFCAHTVCLSKDVTGHCSPFCIALLRSSFCFYYSDSSFPFTFRDFFSLPPHNLFTVCLSKDVAGTLFFICFFHDPSDNSCLLLFAQCVCPKT